MKTLKLTSIIVAFLLTSTVSVSAKSAVIVNNIEQARKVVLENIEENIQKSNVLSGMESDFTTEYIIYCVVDYVNTVHVLRMDGENDLLKQRITDSIEKMQIETDSILQGDSFVFKLKCQVR